MKRIFKGKTMCMSKILHFWTNVVELDKYYIFYTNKILISLIIKSN